MTRDEVKTKIMETYGVVLPACRAMVPETRIGHATNDVAILVFIDEPPDADGTVTMKLRGTTREFAREVFQAQMPFLKNVLETLGKPVSPEDFLLVIVDANARAAYIAEIACLNQTDGVLN